MFSTRRNAGPVRRLVLALLAGIALGAGTERSLARSHRGDSYGINGGISPDLAVANVYSGIYGLGYTYRRPYPGDPGVAQPEAPCARTVQKRQGHGGTTACE